MDAYDIFKKLSQGARFKRKNVNNGQTNKTKRSKIEDISHEESDTSIKNEPIDDCYDDVQAEISNGVDNHDSSVVEDRELTLLGSIVATDSGIKKKKQKNANKVFDEKKLSMLEQEKINQYRNQNQINVVGRHIPLPIKEFKDLSIGNDLIENLTKCGYETPTPIQKQAVSIMLARRQILACAPTGSGKTAAFLLPVLHALQEPQKKGFRAVVVCPTRELAKQTQRECVRLGEGRGFRIHVISKINQGLVKYGPKSNQKFDILVTTPNRLCFLLSQEPPALSLANVEWLIVDEADKLFEKGLRGFREQLDQIMAACTSSQLRIAMFSATQTAEVGRWCRKNMKGLINVTIGQRLPENPDIHPTNLDESNAATDLVEQELLFVGNESGKLVAFRNLVHKGLAPPVLVFVQSKERAQQLFSELIYDGINVDAIHADRTQMQRDNTVRSFREGKVWVLICTELMARGVDFKGVNLVVNYDFPPSAIAYIHRVGRAGRAGRKGKAITFFTTDDTANLRSIAHVLRQSGCEVPEYMLAIKKKSKKERNKVIDREEITTKPKYVREKNEKKRNRFVKPLSATNTDETKTKNTKEVTKIDRTEKKKMLNKKKNLDDNMRKKPAKLKTSLKKNAKKMNGLGGKKLGKKKQNNSVSKS